MSVFRRAAQRRGTPADYLVVGLGNPGDKYLGNKHEDQNDYEDEQGSLWSLKDYYHLDEEEEEDTESEDEEADDEDESADDEDEMDEEEDEEE